MCFFFGSNPKLNKLRLFQKNTNKAVKNLIVSISLYNIWAECPIRRSRDGRTGLRPGWITP